MGEYGLLAAVLVAIYAIEGMVWVSQRSAVLIARPRGEWGSGSELMSFDGLGRALHAGSLIPGGGGVSRCELAPPPVSPFGVCGCEGRVGSADLRSALSFAQLDRVTANGDRVDLGPDRYLRTGSPARSRRVADLILELKVLPEAKRGSCIDAELRTMLNLRRIANRVRLFRRGATELVCAQRMFAILLLLLPLAAGFLGPSGAVVLLGPVLLALLWTLERFHALHTHLFPDSGAARRDHLLGMILMPAAAARAVELVSRDLCANFHVHAVARQTCSEATGRALLAPALRRIAHPLEEDEKYCCAAAAWTGARWKALLLEWAEREFESSRPWLVPPSPDSANCIAYCPRCHHQFTRPDGTCPDCGDISLLPLPLRVAVDP